ncbi:uncharacterized protein ATNIH1004_006880 [Aspergillus tanneri]|uniref:FAD-binding domain-containing protein n=1 Tax=Aspergillus tanneri TaxID=1220188 RepID=A0A5M9MEU3_9EURO|nr:uncharacterized protein ATNIH1004_006880 [Aspergillus tanneri]KAA8645461.1 hypothetical protein ATNIH1004_006880 [Aspergillus tanneri]
MKDRSKVDVLIVGTGRAGLMAAAWMAQAIINTLVVNAKLAHTQSGRADGLESRNMEIFDSFGWPKRSGKNPVIPTFYAFG